MSGEVAGYRNLVESLAQKFVGRNGAEFDDLVQEGLIFVWQSLERGVSPKAFFIEGRMRDWVRLLGYQTGKYLTKLDQNGRPIEVPYEVLLPLTDFPHLTRDQIPGADDAEALLNEGRVDAVLETLRAHDDVLGY